MIRFSSAVLMSYNCYDRGIYTEPWEAALVSRLLSCRVGYADDKILICCSHKTMCPSGSRLLRASEQRPVKQPFQVTFEKATLKIRFSSAAPERQLWRQQHSEQLLKPGVICVASMQSISSAHSSGTNQTRPAKAVTATVQLCYYACLPPMSSGHSTNPHTTVSRSLLIIKQ